MGPGTIEKRVSITVKPGVGPLCSEEQMHLIGQNGIAIVKRSIYSLTSTGQHKVRVILCSTVFDYEL